MERWRDGEKGRWREGEMERRGDGEKGRWREGEMERRGDGEMERRRDGEMERWKMGGWNGEGGQVFQCCSCSGE
jgi:hypothetical protein